MTANTIIVTMKLLVTLLIVSLSWVQAEEKCVKIVQDGKIIVDHVKQEDGLQSLYPVCGYFFNEINQTGWSRLHIWTNPESHLNDSTLAYLAGYLEGDFTKTLIELHNDNLWEKYCLRESDFCERAFKFFEDNQAYVQEQVEKNRQSNVYWHQVGLILDQLTGMEEAINSVVKYQPGIRVNTRGKVYLNNIVADIMDLENALNRTVKTLAVGQSFCSSLVKLREDDLLIGHNTWTQFGYMLRVLKKYDFSFETLQGSGKTIPGRVVSMSSYPGIVFSIDDFYMTSAGLAITETTNGNHNKSSFALLRPSGSVFTFTRNMVANRLATDGSTWSTIFGKYNSGTYNNQFIIVDYKKFVPGSDVQNPGLLWILEQMPGSIVARDVTNVLTKQGYWASYNIPYFRETYEIAGYPDLVSEYGSFYIHQENPRARLFARKNQEARDHKSLLKLLRYNNYLQDPESRCNCTPPYSASMSIACRGDLNDPNGSYSIPALGVINEAAIDSKVTSYGLFKQFKMYAISGPTYENVPPFRWSNFSLADQLLHKGHPDLWVFKPVYF